MEIEAVFRPCAELSILSPTRRHILKLAVKDDVSISTVIFDESLEEVTRFLETALSSPRVRTVYLIDNALQPHPSAGLAGSKVRYIRPGRNLGYGRGHNLAMCETVTTARYHLAANIDTTFANDTICSLAEWMDRHEDVAAATPRLLNPDGTMQQLPRLLPAPMDVIGRRFFRRAAWTKRRMERYELAARDYNREVDVAFISGSFMFLRCSALAEIGTFDERYFLYAEDLDLSRRIAARHRAVYLPHVSVYHRWRRSNHTTVRGTLRAVRALASYFSKWGWFADPERDAINARIQAKRDVRPPTFSVGPSTTS